MFLFHNYSNQSEIEFVIPPTKPPTTTLYGPTSRNRQYSTENRLDSAESADSDSKSNSGNPESVVNKGWNFISDVFTATSSFKSAEKSNPQRAHSRDKSTLRTYAPYAKLLPLL